MTTLLEMTTLKIYFLSNFSIFFYSDVDSLVFIYLFYCECILGYLSLCSAGNNTAKDIYGGAYIIATAFRNICAMSIWIGYVGIESAYTGSICAKGASVRSV